jgi:tryptophan-rich sensory protein
MELEQRWRLWSLQIALNALWTPVFFGLKKAKLALYCIFGLWAAVAVCVIVFWQYSWIAGLAFVPLSVVGQCRGTVEPRCVSPEP